MKIGLGSKKFHYLEKTGIFLIMIVLIIGGGCDSSCVPANGSLLQHDLIISSSAGGEVATPGEGTFTYDEGAVVDLVTVADECYEFISWTGDAVADPNSPITTITIDATKSVTANFELLNYSLTVDSTDGGEVTIPGEETFTYDCGTVVNLVATPDAYYGFVEWTGDVNTVADVYTESTTITMNGHCSITANFSLFAGGNGTAIDPYQIADWWHLDNIRNYLSSHFIVINDLDSNSIGYIELASATANEGRGWQSIGSTDVNDSFVGSFDGQGHEICDLFIDRPDEPDVGLFGAVEELGVIENVGVVNGIMTGLDNTGGLAGKNEGTVNNSYASGNVTGNLNVGGLVGWNFEGTVTGTYSTGNVTGLDNVGGLTGKNAGTVDNSYATDSVTGDDNIGGLVGKNDNTGTVSDSYSTGSVTGESHVGGLMGRNQGTESNSFWDTQTSGQATSAGGTGKTTVEMQEITTFSGASWDIIAVSDSDDRNTSYVWNIVDDETYPFLSWQS